MKENGKKFSLEIADVIDPEQEAAVIEAVKEYVKKNREELQEYFMSTDTIVVGGLGENEARSLRQKLERFKVTTELRGPGARDAKGDDSEKRASVTCPSCGTRLESLDWRCPECFYEFPEYEYMDEGE